MSSPIHRFLFSPPTSPRLLPTDGKGRAPHLTSLKSLIPAELMPSSLDNSDYSNGLRPRSPRTPQQKHFTLDAAYPGGLPSPRNTGSVILQVEDLDATPRLKSGRTTPTQSYPQEKSVTSPTFLPVNIPSAPLPISSGLPRPLLRLMFLASLVLASIMLLIFVPAARLPSLHTASVARRLALDTEGYAYNDVVNPITSHQDALDRDYAPPQIKAAHMMKRSFAGQVIDAENAFLAGFMRNPAIAPPKANRPSPAAQPLPPSHELLALQSYLLESSYNRLTSTVNPLEPLDANILLGFEPSPLALGELEREREHEVVVWYGSNGLSNLPHDLLDMISEAHGTSRKPTLLPIHSRPDRSTILSVLERLGLPLNRSPLLVIGNKAYVADQQTLSNLKINGRLSELLSSIGWVRTEKDGKTVKKTAWKPKMAKVGKKVTTEIEDALNQVKK